MLSGPIVLERDSLTKALLSFYSPLLSRPVGGTQGVRGLLAGSSPAEASTSLRLGSLDSCPSPGRMECRNGLVLARKNTFPHLFPILHSAFHVGSLKLVMGVGAVFITWRLAAATDQSFFSSSESHQCLHLLALSPENYGSQVS